MDRGCSPLYVPATQSVHAEAASPDTEPAEQFWQTVLDVALATLEAEPALQFEQNPANPTLASVVYVPAVQSAHAVAAAAANCPAVQFWHTEAPVPAEYRPGGHGVQ